MKVYKVAIELLSKQSPKKKKGWFDHIFVKINVKMDKEITEGEIEIKVHCFYFSVMTNKLMLPCQKFILEKKYINN